MKDVPRIIGEAEIATDDVLQQSDGRIFGKYLNHVSQHGAHGKEPLCGRTYVRKPNIVQKNLLNNEGRHLKHQKFDEESEETFPLSLLL